MHVYCIVSGIISFIIGMITSTTISADMGSAWGFGWVYFWMSYPWGFGWIMSKLRGIDLNSIAQTRYTVYGDSAYATGHIGVILLPLIGGSFVGMVCMPLYTVLYLIRIGQYHLGKLPGHFIFWPALAAYVAMYAVPLAQMAQRLA